MFEQGHADAPPQCTRKLFFRRRQIDDVVFVVIIVVAAAAAAVPLLHFDEIEGPNRTSRTRRENPSQILYIIFGCKGEDNVSDHGIHKLGSLLYTPETDETKNIGIFLELKLFFYKYGNEPP